MIDAACGLNKPALPPRQLTEEEKEACVQLSRDVLSDLRHYYPEVVKTRPTTWPIHLKHTIESMAAEMLRERIAMLPANIRHEPRPTE